MMMKDKKSRAGAIFLLCVLCSAFSLGSFAEQSSFQQDSSAPLLSKENSELEKNLSSGSIYDESTAVMLDPSDAADNKTDSVSDKKTANERKTVDQPALKTDSGKHLVSVFMGLAVIIVLILALGWIVRRFSQGGIFTQSSIKVVAALPMGTRERLVVVDIAGQQILLGVTATQINKLHVFDEPVIDVSQSAAHSEFGRKLFSVMQQKATGNSSTASNTSTPKE
jgi:flagellar protein FliO/FliZ